VREEVRRKLDELASRLGMTSPNDVIAFLLSRYEEFTDISVKLEKLLTDLSVRLERLLTDKSVNLSPSLTDKSVSNPPALTDVSVSPSPPPTTARGSTEDITESHIWCRRKSEVRNLKGFLDWVEHNFKLLDWWEEGEKYCFETGRSPKEKGRRRGGGRG
jgi:hypothetical protein